MKDSKSKPLNPDRLVDPQSLPKVTLQWRGDLPHIYKDGCTYFVTFCLADVVPDKLRRRARIENEKDPTSIAEHFDLNPSAGSCLLGQQNIAAIVETAMLFFQGERYALSAWCVMPNHVHAVVTPFSGHTLSNILHSWKSFSAHEINRVLKRSGTVWEPESFDHLVRSERAFEQFVEYTEHNPVVAGLCRSTGEWPFSSGQRRESED